MVGPPPSSSTGPHDLGGALHDLLPLDPRDKPYAFWERQTHGVVW